MNTSFSHKLWSVAFVAASVVILCACGRTTASETKNVFGPDNREETQDIAPYRAIGRLDSGCTGALVARNIVLTAAHCVIDPATGTVKPEVKFFRPNLRDGRSTKPTWVNYLWIASRDPENDRMNDWAFLRLDQNVGDEFGTLPLISLDVSTQLPFTVSLVGYSSDKMNGDTQNIHRGCYVHKVVDGRLHHDCDAQAGISGAPLLTMVNGNQYIVAITVSEFRQGASGSVTRDQYSEDYANVAIPASTFYETSKTLIGGVDGGNLPHFENLIEMVNPNNRDQTDHPSDPGNTQPDQPGDGTVGDHLASPDVIMQRAQTIRQKLNDLGNAIRFIRDVAYRIQYRDVLVQTPRILGDVQTFDRTVAAIINHDLGSSTYAEPLTGSYGRLHSDAEYYSGLDSGRVPGPFVSDFERARDDVQELIQDLGTLITQ